MSLLNKRYREVAMPDHRGPLTGPLVGPVATPNAAQPPAENLDKIAQLLRDMPMQLVQFFRKYYVVQPREALPFVAVPSSNPVAIPPSSSATLCSYTVPDKFAGYLTGIGVQVGTPGANVTFTLQINGIPHPTFINQAIIHDCLDTPIPFVYEVTTGKLLELVINNNETAATIYVSGILEGWTEFLTDNKNYGITPMGGAL